MINIVREDRTLIATAGGRIDGTNAREFQTTLEAAIDSNDDTVVLDLGDLSYISSAGLRVMLITAKALQVRNAKFVVCGLSVPIREIFKISGFDQIIPVYDSQEEAVDAL